MISSVLPSKKYIFKWSNYILIRVFSIVVIKLLSKYLLQNIFIDKKDKKDKKDKNKLLLGFKMTTLPFDILYILFDYCPLEFLKLNHEIRQMVITYKHQKLFRFFDRKIQKLYMNLLIQISLTKNTLTYDTYIKSDDVYVILNDNDNSNIF
jgi:hypothetical protein